MTRNGFYPRVTDKQLIDFCNDLCYTNPTRHDINLGLDAIWDLYQERGLDQNNQIRTAKDYRIEFLESRNKKLDSSLRILVKTAKLMLEATLNQHPNEKPEPGSPADILSHRVAVIESWLAEFSVPELPIKVESVYTPLREAPIGPGWSSGDGQLAYHIPSGEGYFDWDNDKQAFVYHRNKKK
jgi:hypothetical protein